MNKTDFFLLNGIIYISTNNIYFSKLNNCFASKESQWLNN